MNTTARFIGVACQKKAPTAKHRPVLWENMLGTVYARNEKGVCKYFDYDIKSAKEYVGLSTLSDLRLWRAGKSSSENSPRPGQFVLYGVFGAAADGETAVRGDA